jgi:hypothetical protein
MSRDATACKTTRIIVPLTLVALALTSTATWFPPKTINANGNRSCFGSRIDHVDAAKIARNTVFIAGVRTDGTLTSSATGFVVRGRRGVRIVTAFHVVEPDAGESSSTLMVFFSDGAPLGVPRVVAATAPRKSTISSVELTVDDLAVVEIARFAGPAALRRLSRLDGMQVAASGPLMVGETDSRTGVAWGYSGSAAVDQEGHVVGVLTSADFRGRVSINLATIQEAKIGGRLIDVATTLPDRSLVVVEPIQDPAIIHELEPARVPFERRRTIRVVFAGFPSASCASTSARLQPATSPAGAELLGKWGVMDDSDAWRIPPRFSIKTVSFSYP